MDEKPPLNFDGSIRDVTEMVDLTIKHGDNIGITWFFNEGYIMGLKGCLTGISYGSYTRYILGIYWVCTGYCIYWNM